MSIEICLPVFLPSAFEIFRSSQENLLRKFLKLLKQTVNDTIDAVLLNLGALRCNFRKQNRREEEKDPVWKVEFARCLQNEID